MVVIEVGALVLRNLGFRSMWGNLAVVGALLVGLFVTVGGAAAGAASASGTPLRLGVISSDSGASGSTQDQSTTVNRWVSYVNSHGGVNGHPVKLFYFDDTDSAATATQNAQTLVNDHVVAIMDASQTGAAYAPVADAAHVPVISLEGNLSAPSYTKDANLFATSDTVPTLFWNIAKTPALAHEKKLGLLYCSEVAACAQLVPAVTAFAKPLGVTIAYSAGFSGSAPNYTALCLAAKQAGVDSLAPVGPVVAANQRVIDDCAKQGYYPVPQFDGVAIGPTFTSDPAIKKFQGFTNTIPWYVHNSSTKTIDNVMGSYLPHALVVARVFDDWAGLQVFAAAANKIPASATPTADDIYTGLYSLHNFTAGGMTVPLTYHKGQPTPILCTFEIGYKNGPHGQYYLPEGLKPVCEPASAAS